jgi:hypothetical protein
MKMVDRLIEPSNLDEAKTTNNILPWTWELKNEDSS